jgi:hypothetical protein
MVKAESVAGVEIESVAGVKTESLADVVKIESFPIGPGAASKGSRPAIGTGHGGAHTNTAAGLRINLRKGEPKVF